MSLQSIIAQGFDNSTKRGTHIHVERFEIQMTRAQASAASHQGRCDEDVAQLVRDPAIAAQLSKIGADSIRDELREYGAWDETELSDDQQNWHRIVWLAAGNIRDIAKVQS